MYKLSEIEIGDTIEYGRYKTLRGEAIGIGPSYSGNKCVLLVLLDSEYGWTIEDGNSVLDKGKFNYKPYIGRNGYFINAEQITNIIKNNISVKEKISNALLHGEVLHVPVTNN